MVLSEGSVSVTAICLFRYSPARTAADSSRPRAARASFNRPSPEACSRPRSILPKCSPVSLLLPLISPFQKGSLAPSVCVWVTVTVSRPIRSTFHAKAPRINRSPIRVSQMNSSSASPTFTPASVRTVYSPLSGMVPPAETARIRL